MKMFVIFVVVFAAAVNSSCVQYGIDYAGYDIQSISNSNHWSDCAGLCNDHQSCSYWTWNIAIKRCFLKHSKAGQRTVSHAISGSQHCLSEC